MPHGQNAPAAAPTVTTPTGSFAQGDQPTITQPNSMLQNLIQVITKAAQKPTLAQPVPAPLPQQQQTQPPGFMQPSGTWGPAWGKERTAYTVGSIIQNAWGQHKANQLAKAESDWTQLLTAMQSGNKQSLDFILQDPKKLKNMAKALNQDWLNPEKTDVYSQALQSALSKHQQKQDAMQGLKQLFGHLIGRATQPKLSPDQKQQMEKEIMSRAPLTSGNDAALKEVLPLVTETMKEEAAAGKQAEEEQFKDYEAQQRQRFDTWKTQSQQAFQSSMEHLRELAADKRESDRQVAMFKALGMRLSEKDRRKLLVTPTQINTELNGTLTSMRQQLTQASTELRTMQTQAQKRSGSLWQRLISTSPDVSGAQQNVTNLQNAINYIEKNRPAIISGKADMDSVIDQAQQIMIGTPPGFK